MYQTAYQTEIFGIIPAKSASAPRRPHVGPCRGLFARDCSMDGLAGKARDRANVGGTWARRGDTLSKLRTVRKIKKVSLIVQCNYELYDNLKKQSFRVIYCYRLASMV